MHRTQPLQTMAALLVVSAILLLTLGCASSLKRFERKTYTASAGGAKGTLEMKNFRFSLKQMDKRNKEGRLKKTYFDVLKLKPGVYVLGFRQVHPRSGGFGLCRMPKAGVFYSFKITDRVYMRGAGGYVLKGECFIDPKRAENIGKK